MTSTLGQTLRAAREAQGQTLDEVSGITRIRGQHLAALENDDYGALPSPVQARGFLKNYAQHLGLDLQEVLGQYEAVYKKGGARPAARLQAQALAPPKREVAPPPRRAPNTAPARAPRAAPAQQIRTRRPRLLSADILVALVITAVLAGLLVWGGAQVAPSLLATATVTSGVAAVGTALGTTQSATFSPAPPTLTSAPPTPAQTFSGVNVTVNAEQRIWVSVKVDGADVYAGLMPPGEAREFIGQSVVEVTTGNGLGTRVIWNGVDQGVLGEMGEVVTRLWTLQGVLVPTPTVTPETSATPGGA